MENLTMMRFLEEMKEGINNRLDAQANDIREIKEQTKKTNGRVTTLETEVSRQRQHCTDHVNNIKARQVSNRWLIGTLIALSGLLITLSQCQS